LRRSPRWRYCSALPSRTQLPGRWLTVLLLAVVTTLAASTPSSAQRRPDEFVLDSGESEQVRIRVEFGDRFRVLETKHFRVISDTSIRYHTVVAGLLEQFLQLVQPRFFEREMEPVSFFLINGGDDYEAFVRERGLPNASGYGLYDSETRSLYARRYFPDGRESGVGTLFHEAVHAMLDADFAGAPPPRWFNEGFASLFEVGRVLRGQWVYGNPNPWRETPFRSAFEQGRVPSLEVLLVTPDAAFDTTKPQRDLLYNSGRSLFLYLLRRHGEPALADFVRRMRNGSQPAAALSAVTGLSLLEVEKRWHASIQELNFGGDYLNRGRGPNGLEVLEEGAQHHPDYGNLQLTLAFEYLNRKELANALEHAQQALEDPHLIFRQHAHYVVARASISTDPNAAARALQTSIEFQPWNEQIFGDDYELMAFMYDKIDQSSRAMHLRSELETMRRLDRR
jgi:hypothetical protein